MTRILKPLIIAIGLVASSFLQADDQVFKNARDIPPPQRGGTGNYIAMPNNVPSEPVNMPKGLPYTPGNSARIEQSLPSSLTQAASIAPEPITLDAATLKQQTVMIDNDDTHVVAVSASSINRISTPFRNPIVLVNGGAKYKVVGQDVYVIMQSDQPIGVFVREDESISSNSPVASLTLVPKAVAPQNITLILENALRERLSNPNKKTATDYQDVLRLTLATIAQHKLPDGYSRSNVNGKAVARIGAVVLRPKAIFAGVENNVYVYTAQNVTTDVVELSEPSFWHAGVRAVSFDGKIKLAPNDTTDILIVADVGNGNESIYD